MTAHRLLVPGRALAAAAVTLSAVLASAAPARAAIAIYDLGFNAAYAQAAGNAPPSLTGYFFSARAFLDGGPGDPTAGTLDYPGPGSPAALTLVAPDLLLFQTGFLPDLATFNAEFPFGPYTLTSDGTPSPLTIDYAADVYPLNAPALTEASFNALQGLNPADPVALEFNPFATNPLADESLVFVSILDAMTFAPVFAAGFLPPDTTAVDVPAGTLLPNTQYLFEVIFSSRLNGTDPLTGVGLVQQFNTRTSGLFTTGAAPAAVPEPAGLGLAAAAGLAWLGRRAARRRQG